MVGLALIGCGGRVQSSCDGDSRCLAQAGQAPASGGSANDPADSGVFAGGTAGRAANAAAGGRAPGSTVNEELPNAGRSDHMGGHGTMAGGSPASGGTGSVAGAADQSAGAAGDENATVDLVWPDPYRTFGTDHVDGATAVNVDRSGNVYIAGNTSGAFASSKAGGSDAFVRKLDPSGATLWTRQFGTPSDDFASAIAIDGDGNVYVAGDTYGALAGENEGAGDSFVIKLDPSGATLWTQQFGSSGPDRLEALTVDGNGNAYVAGSTYPKGGPNWNDAFVRKFAGSGATLWATEFGGSGKDEAQAVAVDGIGNVYVAGGTVDLTEQKAGSRDAFVRKFDARGDVQWTQQFGTSGADEIGAAALDAQGNLYLVGDTSGGLEGENFGSEDAFARKLDPSGATLWTRQIGTTGDDSGSGLAVTENGDVYVVGSTSGGLEGNSSGSDDTYVRKLDTNGNALWTKQVGTASSEVAWGAAISARGTLYIVGYTGTPIAGDAFIVQIPAQSP